jgi:formate hydrogenlyase subunit 3/multisubunit Na+/H+ antiporter MnhD subunit
MMLEAGAAAAVATSPGGGWLVAAVTWPVVAVLLAIVAGGRHAARIALASMPIGLAIAVAIAVRVWTDGEPLTYLVGDWAPPLGIALRADGLSAAMMLTTAIVVTGAGLFAHADFAPKPGEPETRTSLVFWTLLIAVWGAMNLVVMGRDLFNLYVALELLTFAAVPLVSLDGRAATLAAALRYLMFALLGSVLYLLGAVLLYGAYGTLDITLLATRVQPEPAAWAAAALMTSGLLAKTALFPLHLWLPPAHAGAPPAASAVLSALVVKGSFVLLVRLWFEVMPALWGVAATQLIAALGAAAILYGSVLALRQERLKLLIAYSTVAQIGYLFLMFPLAYDPVTTQLRGGVALTGGVLQTVSHAFAKAGMFMAAGLIAKSLGHDRVADLAGVGRALPVSLIAFGLAGVSLVGLPPSGGFAAKWLLLTAAVSTGQWWWATVLVLGGLLTGGYVMLVLVRAMGSRAEPVEPMKPVARSREAIALAMSLCAVLLGLLALGPVELPAFRTSDVSVALAEIGR